MVKKVLILFICFLVTLLCILRKIKIIFEHAVSKRPNMTKLTTIKIRAEYIKIVYDHV